MTEGDEARYRALLTRYDDLLQRYEAALRREPPQVVYHYHYTAPAAAPSYPTVIPWGQSGDLRYWVTWGAAATGTAGGATSVAFAAPASGGAE